MVRDTRRTTSARSRSAQIGTRSQNADTINIVMADDDRNEQLLTVLAAEEANVNAEFTFVDDGTQLLMYLNKRLEAGTLPELILLDLRMPILDGPRTLGQLQDHPVLWQIPVVAFSSSTRSEDRDRSLAAGAKWFQTKPSEYSEMVKFIESLPEKAFSGTYDLGDRNIDLTRNDGLGTLDTIDLDELDLDDVDFTELGFS